MIAWWQDQHPGANIGVNLDFSGLLVLDLDPRHGAVGLATVARYGAVPITMWQRTGGGGAHYLFKRPAGSFRKVDLGGGIEILTSSATVAPSLHESGIRYEWRDSGDTLAPAPRWIVDRARVPVEAPQTAHHGEIDDGAKLTITDVLRVLPQAKRSGRHWRTNCPAHEDRHPSLDVCEGISKE